MACPVPPPDAAGLPVTLADIERAAAIIAPLVRRTPCLYSPRLSAATGAEVWVKFENLQFTASFKERGAATKLSSLTDAQRQAGVIAMSAGNHAQGVAYHARRLGIPATIVMPRFTPFVKVTATRDFGARVVVEGETLAEAGDAAHRIGHAEGLVFVHPYDDPLIVAGQGTIGLEMLADAPELDLIVVPVGGGGLIAGIATAAKALKPSITMLGVQTSSYPVYHQLLRGLPVQAGGTTVAEGIAVSRPGAVPLALIRAHVDDVLLVGDADIERAIILYLEREKTVAEGAGAAGLAALLAHPARFSGRRVGVVLCGGNIDSRLLTHVLLRGLVQDGRLIRLTVEIDDRPGVLSQVAGLIGAEGGNIIDVAHQRLFGSIPAKSADLNLVVETRDSAHAQALIQAIQAAGFLVKPTPL